MIFDRIYQINWQTLPAHFLPVRQRKAKMIAWLKALLKPSKNLHQQFLNFRRDTNYKLDHTPQVFSLENVLNDAFDQQERRIYISDGVYRSPIYFYNPEENSPVHFYNENEGDEPAYFYDPAELQNFDVDFVVIAPAELNPATSISAGISEQYSAVDFAQSVQSVQDSALVIRMRSLIDYYALPDKTYQIQFN